MKKYRLTGKAWSNKEAWRLAHENWTLCHEIVNLRDGHKCIICGTEEDLQLDHVISRACKVTFFETDILQNLCSVHHSHKSFRVGQWVDIKVREICLKRAGKAVFEGLVEASKGTCGGFRTVVFQEQVKIKLNEKLAELLAKGE